MGGHAAREEEGEDKAEPDHEGAPAPDPPRWRDAWARRFSPDYTLSQGGRMKLAEKGRFAPPPKLKGPAQKVSSTLAGWPGVLARTHWQQGDETVVDGADFYVGEDELGHLHLDGEAHIMMPARLASALIGAGLGVPLPWSRSAVVFAIRTEADIRHALWLFKLNRDRLQGTPVDALLARVALAGPRRPHA
jgi:hypothetical protein